MNSFGRILGLFLSEISIDSLWQYDSVANIILKFILFSKSSNEIPFIKGKIKRSKVHTILNNLLYNEIVFVYIRC